MDETAYELKRGKNVWLHEQLASVASEVFGVDSSEKVPQEGLRTGERSAIYRADVCNLAEFLQSRPICPDVIVAGELIEHLPNPLAFLQSLRTHSCLQNKTLLLTTPNATALHNCLIALTKRESTHPDHLTILSYKTLSTLFRRSGFTQWQLIPYYASFTEMKQRVSPVSRPLVRLCERVINGAERIFPLMSFGWIAHINL
jgi:Methyltransferase domain